MTYINQKPRDGIKDNLDMLEFLSSLGIFNPKETFKLRAKLLNGYRTQKKTTND